MKGRALDWVSIEERIVPMLRDGLTCREISAKTGISFGTLYAHLRRIRTDYGIPVPKSRPPARETSDIIHPRDEISQERMVYGEDPLPAHCALARRVLGADHVE